MSPTLEVPAGMEIRRDAAVRVLQQLHAETLEAVRQAALTGRAPKGSGSFSLWVDKHEERLAVLEAALQHFRSLSGLSVIVRGEPDASEVRR